MTAPPGIQQISEAAFQRAILDLARRCSWKVCHFSDSRRSVGAGRLVGDKDAKGWPDLVLARDLLIFAELKTDRGKVSDEQEDWMVALAKATAGSQRVRLHVWRPSDWPEIEIVLTRRPDW